tara:strand:+ start:187 stop:423 length:237 start_codon:yes stop_codon:yes gene_type:complete
MKNTINIRAIKETSFNRRGYKQVRWVCEIDIYKMDGSVRTLKSYEFGKSKKAKLKRDALKDATDYKNYLLSKGDFYFV